MRRLTAPSGDGSAFIVGLLLVCLVLVAALTWQAQDAARSHRRVAEEVLRDYARLAADEFIRRSLSQVGFYGYYKILSALSAEDSATPPSHATLAATADSATRRALPLARYFFTLDATTRRLELSRPAPAAEATAREAPGAMDARAPSAAVAQWLRSELEAPPETVDGDAPAFSVRHPVIDGMQHSFVFRRAETAPDGTPLLLGFEVDGAIQSQWLANALDRGPLLPESLTQAEGESDFLLLTVTDATGHERFRAGHAERLRRDGSAAYLSIQAHYGERYEGLFDGFTVQVSLYPETAARLLIGGLPRSRLPTLIGLLILTVGLLMAAIVQLRRSRDLARLRSDFVSRVSHELRTPLTQIRMFAETLILGRVRTDEERRRSLRIIDQEARRLSHLVENILQFSRSERGTMRLTPEPCQLAPMVRTLVRDFAPLVGAGEVSFVIHPADDAVVAIDGDAMRQILLNLLDNAVKYGPAKQQVRIGIESGSDGMARLRVEDEGPGVPAPERQRIWRSFHRLERDRRSAVAGTGIGLAVVRELVALQSGRIRVEAGRRGGACFVIEMPMVGGQGPAGAPTSASEVPA